MSARVIVATWLICVAIAAAFPLIVATYAASNNGDEISFYSIVGGGDLFLISAIILVGGLGDILLGYGSRLVAAANGQLKEFNWLEVIGPIFIGAGAILVMLVSIGWYGDVRAHDENGYTISDSPTIAWASIVTFALSVLVGSFAVWSEARSR
ncbi:hypothetical protein [Streptomyces sp. NPDC007905]|uniref:hypothetical protein n=1 Tax=Streptomyces sp. NPDC007905 TaxID=3364788 RepID=UPI0036E8DADC